MVAARLYDVDGATQRLIARGVRAPGSAAARAGLPAPPAGLDRPARPRAQARAARAGLDRTCARRPASSRSGQRPAAAAAGRRRAGQGPRRRDRVGRRRRSSCRPATSSRASTRPRRPGGVGGTVPATLSLTMGAAASFGTFQPGVGRDVHGVDDRDRDLDRRRRGADGHGPEQRSPPGAWSTGRSRSRSRCSSRAHPCPRRSRPTPRPVSNDVVTVGFSQTIGANEPLRTGSYAQDADLHALDDESLVAEGRRRTAAVASPRRHLPSRLPYHRACSACDVSDERVGAWAVLVSAEAPAASEPVSASGRDGGDGRVPEPPLVAPRARAERRALPGSGSRHRRTGSVPCRDRSATRGDRHVGRGRRSEAPPER